MPKINQIDVNQAQYEAIIHGKGPMLVIAGPGSGKTTVITQRILYLITHLKVKPEEILVITFTKAAAKEMQERFQKLLKGEQNQVIFGTFHAIFFHILKQAYHYQNNNILREAEKYQFLKEAMQSVTFESESIYEDSLLKTELMQLILVEISKIKNAGMKLSNYSVSFMDSALFCSIYHKYHAILREHRKLDFDDMVLQCYQLLQQRKDILEEWQRRFSYILIDEFQDICPLQFRVIALLAGKEQNLFVVGDDDQSIYHFRGSSPQIMIDFPHFFPTAKQILLNINYRSQKPILDGSLNLISYNTNRFPKQVEAFQISNSNFPISLKKYEKEMMQYDAMISEIKTYFQEHGSYKELAVLFRTNIGISTFAEKCSVEKIPFEIKERVDNLYHHFYVEDIISYIKFANGDHSRAIFYQIMNKPVRYIQRCAVKTQIVKEEELRSYYREKSYIQKKIEDFYRQCAFIKEMSPFAAVNYIRKGIGYDEYLRQYCKEKNSTVEDIFGKLNDLQESLRTFDTISEWLLHIEAYEKELEHSKTHIEKKDAVKLVTMHAAKGLEWDRVWIPDINEGNIPSKKAFTTEEIEEERRLLYVGMTRAREKLYLSCVETKKEEYNEDKIKKVSRFWKEIAEKNTLMKR